MVHAWKRGIPIVDPVCISFLPHDHFEDLGVDGRIILKWIYKK
jgi:hypothetical protein